MMSPVKSTHLKSPPKELTQEQLVTLYMQAIVVLPEVLDRISAILDEMTDQLSTMAIYCEKKGLAEGVLSEEDFTGLDKKEAADGTDAGSQAPRVSA